MSVKILHAADFHMDSPFDALSEEKAMERRREQRDIFKKIAEVAHAEKTDIVLLAGDLFDSDTAYFETCETIKQVFSDISAHVFIAPGNHDYYCAKSPYTFMEFPKNIHIFKSPIIQHIDIPGLNCRVWGAGFNTPVSGPLLSGFSADDGNMINIMLLHGELGGNMYNPITEDEIAASGLDYLALGHTHSFSGVKKAGNTFYAYPGCPEGRGFDETGTKGIITGTVSKGSCELRFVPTSAREYNILNVDLTGKTELISAIHEAIADLSSKDIYRIILKGEFDGEIDPIRLADVFKDSFYNVTFRDETRVCGDIWGGIDENSLRGLFLMSMREKFDSASDESEKEKITMAVRFALAAIDSREEWRP